MYVMNRFVARACVAAAAGVALSTVAVAGASASGGGGAMARPGAGGGPAILRAGAARAGAASVNNSRIFAGYVAAVPVGSATSVTATFTVPALSCAPPDLGIAPGVFESVNRNGLLTAAGVAVKCESGK